ncbi:hypothetical protein GCM10011415_32070 [Salipiger pallidus]|uniref:SH3b domain-containing protein n=1 Tax=Salipiger pallidus TaxID=1775170 RepID=A0A8J2ZLW7_9RHOB|nr:SH3 domain-containing protein [Salipiger pallidus]GGG80295.1 hypothetical protein GCM10011415_32070 [Salipiger pallidus]
MPRPTILTAITAMTLGACATAVISGSPLPALYDVTDVASDDVLNVRAAPEAGAEILGALPFAQTRTEVTALSDDGSWGRVNLREQAGWVNMRYMARQQGSTIGEGAAFSCYGTEPFWSLIHTPGGTFSWSDIEGNNLELSASSPEPVPGAGHVAHASGPGQKASIAIKPVQACSDGMSDRLFGLEALVTLTGKRDGTYRGCCSVQPQ